VFARLGGPKAASPVESNPVFLKTLVFPKNQEKDVWHALLSFQGTAPPDSFAIRQTGAVPPATVKTHLDDGPFSLIVLGFRVNRKIAHPHLRTRRLTPT
jgi:hypothetical protein